MTAGAPVILVLHPTDDVGVVRRSVASGSPLPTDRGVVTACRDIPAGHKIALHPIPDAAPVRKYGQVIGFAQGAIPVGDHVHTHNLVAREFERAAAPPGRAHRARMTPSSPIAPVFSGYLRPDGRVGTRNYLAVISSVNCSASVARHVKERFPDEVVRRDYPNVDGVVAFTHKSGCSMLPGEPLTLLRRVLVGLAKHPNIGGCVMIGLGCEVNQIESLRAICGPDRAADTGSASPVFLEIQTQGGVRRTVQAGVSAVARLLPNVNDSRRTPQPVRHLVLAEQCGGSDAHSGITANPALGWASDELVRHGGTSVLAETPEIYGAEHLLLERALEPEVREQLLDRIRWWENHVRLYGATIDNNPSPGNKAGGLTTIYEKSLGAVAKSGQSPLAAVYEYASPITASGLCFMDTPGNDPVSMTGLVAGGCTLAVFTTGRGSVYGCKPTPCLKVASNTALFTWLEDDIDLNAGTILDGTERVEDVGRRIFQKMLEVASGERTKSEQAGMGDEEFAPWQWGPTF